MTESRTPWTPGMPGQIYDLIPKVSKAVGAVGKDGEMKMGERTKYAYRKIDDIVNAVHGPFADFGITVVREILSAEHRKQVTIEKFNTGEKTSRSYLSIVRCRFTYFAPDGSFVCSSEEGMGWDSLDKSANKAMTAAYKNSLAVTLSIPFATDDADGQYGEDGEEGEGREAKPKTRLQQALDWGKENAMLLEKAKLNDKWTKAVTACDLPKLEELAGTVIALKKEGKL